MFQWDAPFASHSSRHSSVFPVSQNQEPNGMDRWDISVEGRHIYFDSNDGPKCWDTHICSPSNVAQIWRAYFFVEQKLPTPWQKWYFGFGGQEQDRLRDYCWEHLGISNSEASDVKTNIFQELSAILVLGGVVIFCFNRHVSILTSEAILLVLESVMNLFCHWFFGSERCLKC